MTDRRPTLDEVAKAAGVSRATASRAINGGLRVSPQAQRAVDTAVKRLGFVPNRAARALATSQHGSIALVISEPDELFLSDPFLTGVLRGVSGALEGIDLQLVLLIANRNRPAERMAQFLGGGHVDGAIITSLHRGDMMEDQVRGLLPTVFIGRPFDHEGLTYVDVDNEKGGQIATRVLIDAGRRHIGTISGPSDMTASLDRIAGWRRTLSEAGLSTDAIESGNFTIKGAEEATHRLLERFPETDGIFVASDTMAIGVHRAIAAAGKRVPSDIALVGFDNLGMADATTPRLTTVNNPLLRMVESATKMLLERIARKDLPAEQMILTPTLVPGESV